MKNNNNLKREGGIDGRSAHTVLCIVCYFKLLFFFSLYLNRVINKSWTLFFFSFVLCSESRTLFFFFFWLSLDLHLQNWVGNLRRKSHKIFHYVLISCIEAEICYQLRLPYGICVFNPSVKQKLIGQCENGKITEVKILFKPWRSCSGLNRSLDREFWLPIQFSMASVENHSASNIILSHPIQ